MAATLITTPNASTPSHTPDIEDDYNAQNANLFQMFRGYNALSLTEWTSANTTLPEVEADSVMEVGGALYEFAAQEAITTTGISAGTVYAVFDASTLGLYLTNTAPVWSVSLNGWYDATLTDRYTGHVMEYDGSAYNEKAELIRNNQTGNLIAINVDGYIYTVSGSLAPQDPPIITVNNATSTVLPAGFVQLIDCTATAGAGRTFSLQVYGDSSWTTIYQLSISSNSTSLFDFSQFWSNGNNYRIIETTGTYQNFRYLVYSG